MTDMLGETLKDTMPGISNIRLTVDRMNGVKYFAADCLFHNLSKEQMVPVFDVDKGKDALKPKRTPIECRIRLTAPTLPALISLIEEAATEFQASGALIEHARF